MAKICTGKRNLCGQSKTTTISSVNKTFNLKSSFGGQNIYYKKWFRWIIYIL